jgi:hypothetical protein
MNIPAMRDERGHRGPERRRNQLLVTRHREYHCHDGWCVAVRDRGTGQFVPDHSAIGKRLTGGMQVTGDEILGVSEPQALVPGTRLCFSSCDGHLDKDIITSALVAIERPPKEVVVSYPQLRH